MISSTPSNFTRIPLGAISALKSFCLLICFIPLLWDTSEANHGEPFHKAVMIEYVGVVHGGVPEGPQRKLLDAPLDVLVATPGRLVQHLDAGSLFLGDVRHVVLDEVDTMFDAGFGPELDRAGVHRER